MVGMEVRNHDGVDVGRFDAGGGELAFMNPAVSANCPAVPVSIRTSCFPVLTNSAVNEIGRMFGGRKAAASALLSAATAGVADELAVDRQKPGAVVKRGELENRRACSDRRRGLAPVASGAAARLTLGSAAAPAVSAEAARKERRDTGVSMSRFLLYCFMRRVGCLCNTTPPIIVRTGL